MFLRKKNVTKTGPDPPPNVKNVVFFLRLPLGGGLTNVKLFFFLKASLTQFFALLQVNIRFVLKTTLTIFQMNTKTL